MQTVFDTVHLKGKAAEKKTIKVAYVSPLYKSYREIGTGRLRDIYGHAYTPVWEIWNNGQSALFCIEIVETFDWMFCCDDVIKSYTMINVKDEKYQELPLLPDGTGLYSGFADLYGLFELKDKKKYNLTFVSSALAVQYFNALHKDVELTACESDLKKGQDYPTLVVYRVNIKKSADVDQDKSGKGEPQSLDL